MRTIGEEIGEQHWIVERDFQRRLFFKRLLWLLAAIGGIILNLLAS